MKVVKVFAAVLMAGLLSSHGIAQTPSETLVSPNLISICSNPAAGSACGNQWSNTTTYTGTGGGTSGGSTPGYNSSTNTIYFGYQQATVANIYAFNTALQTSGMSILGYNYSWQYINQDMSSGNLSAAVNFAGTNGTSLHSKTWTLGPTTNGWTTTSGTETLTSPGLLASQIANISLSFSGKDSRFWAGYYGPQVKDPSLTLNYTFDACAVNPLSSPDCPGYAAALLTQQCTANPLYSPSCPGYAAAYLTQQCTINPLSDPQCPGYATAYLNYQCSINPLYATTCAGYETAYFNQQCSINALYNTKCEGYAQAYLDAQCIKDSLYSTECKGYATAYAIKYLVPLDSTTSTAVNTSLSNTAAVAASDPANTKVATNTVSTTINTDGSVSIGVSKTGDTNVDKAIAPPPPSVNSAAAPSAPVQLAPPPPGPQQPQRAEKREEPAGERQARRENGPGQGPAGGLQMTQQGGERPAQPTVRDALNERRQAAARAEAVEKGKNLANEMGKVADMEQQKQIQNVVIQAMGFTQGFDAYAKATLPDGVGYKPFTVYNNQRNIENRNTLRMFGGTERLHNEMVESQYNLGK